MESIKILMATFHFHFVSYYLFIFYIHGFISKISLYARYLMNYSRHVLIILLLFMKICRVVPYLTRALDLRTWGVMMMTKFHTEEHLLRSKYTFSWLSFFLELQDNIPSGTQYFICYLFLLLVDVSSRPMNKSTGLESREDDLDEFSQ